MPGQPNAPPAQANFFNVGEQLFGVSVTNLSVTKNATTVRDPVNAATSPKGIPGAWLEYAVVVARPRGRRCNLS